MNTITKCLDNQSGSATLVALLVLTLLAIMGMSGARTASVELEITKNDHLNRLAFYSAEASRAYVMLHPQLYGVDNIDDDPDQAHQFPIPENKLDPYEATTVVEDPVAPNTIENNNQFYSGAVAYTRPTLPPRGSGYDTGNFRAHQYSMKCKGEGPSGEKKTITAGFYRIGF